MNYISKNSNQTKKIAATIAERFKQTGGVIALMGDLGAGKTTFTQGFARALGITEKVISPTFVITRQHQIPDKDRWLFHIDLYRIEQDIDINESGIQEMIGQTDSIVLIEWPEKILNKLPSKTLKISIKKISENERLLTVL